VEIGNRRRPSSSKERQDILNHELAGQVHDATDHIISAKVSPTHKGADSRGCIVGFPTASTSTSKREPGGRASTITRAVATLAPITQPAFALGKPGQAHREGKQEPCRLPPSEGAELELLRGTPGRDVLMRTGVDQFKFRSEYRGKADRIVPGDR
jgi:hypothetical protein